MRFLVPALLSVVATAGLGGCGGDDNSAAPPKETVTVTATEDATSSAPSAPTSSSSSPSPEPEPPEEPRVGDTFATSSARVTLQRFEVVRGFGGSPGEEEAFEVFVKTCVPDDASAPYPTSVFNFVAVTNDGLQVAASTLYSGVREPTYPTFGDVQPGRCVQGWVQIVMPEGTAKRVESVELLDETTQEPVTAWSLARR